MKIMAFTVWGMAAVVTAALWGLKVATAKAYQAWVSIVFDPVFDWADGVIDPRP